MKLKLIAILALLMGAGIPSIEAQVHQRAQKARIAQGIRSGELTRYEAHRLLREQQRIHRHTHRARLNDGRIGPRERRLLAYEKRKASRHIYRYKHNRFDRS
jgi:uncharacterized protein YwbE